MSIIVLSVEYLSHRPPSIIIIINTPETRASEEGRCRVAGKSKKLDYGIRHSSVESISGFTKLYFIVF